MKILVVEDEPIYLNTLLIMLEEIGYENLFTADNSESALELFLTKQPDLVLMDIHIKGRKDGIEVADIITQSHKPIPVIFITSLQDNKTFERAQTTNPVNFFVKPFDKETLKISIEIAIHNFYKSKKEKTETTNWQTDIAAKDSLFIKQKHRLIKILLEDITFINADLKYVELNLKEEKYVIRMSLKELEKNLPSELFLRVSRSVIVNTSFINQIELDKNLIILKTQEQIQFSKSYRTELLKRLNIVI